jgi:hypothetical protein
MMMTDWHELHDELAQCPWFTRVGQRMERDGDPLVRRVGTWAEASRWAEEDISLWCVNEASNVLSEFLHIHYNREYQAWNSHIASFGPALDDLIAGPVTTALPPEARTPGVMNWIRSHLTSAYLECAYSSMSNVDLVRNQVEWYMLGHFPCGWFVGEESAFPHSAVAIVY